jgi:Fe-S cluster biogenesis protein NfuA/nitrite reductase/ring-hydroxylating ferredoxin subunit
MSAAVDSERHLARVQELTEALEAMPDGHQKDVAESLVGAIVELYGDGLARIVDILGDSGVAGQEIHERLVDDGVVASLLLIHDLYPIDLETRVREALDTVRPYMESHGGNVEFLGVHENIAHLRLQGSCKSCSASSSTLELAVRQALEEAAPDLEGMEVEGVVEEPTGSPLAVLQQPSWFALEAGAVPGPDGLVGTEVAGAALVVADVEGTLLAYRDRCAGCGEQLRGGELLAGALTCPGCSRSFFLPRAGRSLDGDGLQLEPVPLLREGEAVRVALSP